jgi:uncharacterized protein (DUF4415 family)
MVLPYRPLSPRRRKREPTEYTELPPLKEQVSIRLDTDVIAALKADGPGWTTKANTLLRKALKL